LFCFDADNISSTFQLTCTLLPQHTEPEFVEKVSSPQQAFTVSSTSWSWFPQHMTSPLQRIQRVICIICLINKN